MATLLRGFDIEIVESKEKKGSWVVQPGDIPVTEVKEVCSNSPTDLHLADLRTGVERKNSVHGRSALAQLTQHI